MAEREIKSLEIISIDYLENQIKQEKDGYEREIKIYEEELLEAINYNNTLKNSINEQRLKLAKIASQCDALTFLASEKLAIAKKPILN